MRSAKPCSCNRGFGNHGRIGGQGAQGATDHRVIGWDQNPGVLEQALAQEPSTPWAERTPCRIPTCCSWRSTPGGDRFRAPAPCADSAKCLVVDFCGVKGPVVAALEEPCRQAGVAFIGGHPMAGREFSGFDHSLADLFVGAA